MVCKILFCLRIPRYSRKVVEKRQREAIAEDFAFLTNAKMLLYGCLESIFIEIRFDINKKRSISFIYRHPHIPINYFCDYFLIKCLNKIAIMDNTSLLIYDFKMTIWKSRHCHLGISICIGVGIGIVIQIKALSSTEYKSPFEIEVIVIYIFVITNSTTCNVFINVSRQYLTLNLDADECIRIYVVA